MKKRKKPFASALAVIITLQGMAGVQAQTTAVGAAGFTRSAQNALGGNRNIRASIVAGYNNTRRAMSRSRAGNTVRTSSLALFPNYSEAGRDVGSVLGDWRRRRVGRNGANETQLGFERRLRADLMMFLSNVTTGSNGQGENINGQGGSYSSIRANRGRQPTFPHEIGHNYACGHNQSNRLARTNNNDLPRSVYTLLGSAGRNFGAVINNYSNPNVRYRRARTGSASRNNVGAIVRTRNARANRRIVTAVPAG